MPVGNAVPVPRAAWHVVATVLATLLGYLAATVLAYLVAGPTGSTSTFVVAQTVAALLVLLATTRWRAGAGLARGLPAVRWSGVPVLVAHLLLPTTWVGRALLGHAVVGAGPLAAALDVVVWTAVTALGVRWAAGQVPLRPVPLTPYG